MKEDLEQIKNTDFSKLTAEQISEILDKLLSIIDEEENKLITLKIEE